MLLRETIRKTKVLVHKTLRNFKSMLFGGYQKLPRSLSFNPFLGRSANARSYRSDRFYNEFYDMLQSDLDRISMPRDPAAMEDRDQDAAASVAGSPQKGGGVVPEEEDRAIKEEKKKKKEEDSSYQHVLAQRMKELEMMDSGDVEHVLDIEEALHYYSRLTSPVYLDIVDKFFVDIHSEISLVPQPSSVRVKVKRSMSKRRHGSISGCR